jgi:hypothetical protein
MRNEHTYEFFDDDVYAGECYYAENFDELYTNNDYDYEGYYENEYQSQPVSCLPVFLAVTVTIGFLVFVFSRIEISDSVTTAAVKVSESNGQGGGIISPLFTPEVQHWSSSIAQWSQQTGIDPNIIATVMQIESCGDPFAKSSAGAMGLFQVMPYHFENGEDPYKPATNARRGLGYLQRALAARGEVVRLGLAGYNGGITGAKRSESQWASETQRYVYWGTGIYQDAIDGKMTSGRLDEWLSRGGSSLCKQAAQRLGIEP